LLSQAVATKPVSAKRKRYMNKQKARKKAKKAAKAAKNNPDAYDSDDDVIGLNRRAEAAAAAEADAGATAAAAADATAKGGDLKSWILNLNNKKERQQELAAAAASSSSSSSSSSLQKPTYRFGDAETIGFDDIVDRPPQFDVL
jgi:hypothetical protein